MSNRSYYQTEKYSVRGPDLYYYDPKEPDLYFVALPLRYGVNVSYYGSRRQQIIRNEKMNFGKAPPTPKRARK